MFQINYVSFTVDWFNSFLYKIRKAPYLGYSFCDEQQDMADHTVLGCTAWEEQLAELMVQVDEIMADNLVAKMLQSFDTWKANKVHNEK